jgi:threonine 3-dehydrogenase
MPTMITGGTGFLGSYLARLLINKGEKPILYDIAPPGAMLNDLKGKYEFVKGSLLNISELINCLEAYSIDKIFHLGGMLSLPSEENPWAAFDVNVIGTHNVLEASRIKGVKQVLFGSTIATFSDDIPTDIVDDLTIQHPNSMYGTTKVMCELMGRYYGLRFGIDFRAIRIPSVVGPGAKTRHMSIYNCWSIEESLRGRPYELFCEPQTRCATIYFKDAAKALILLSEAKKEDIKTVVYNISGIIPSYSAQELADIIRDRIPDAQLSFNPDPNAVKLLKKLGQLVFSDERAQKEWGWKNSYDLSAMVDDFIKEFKENNSWYV